MNEKEHILYQKNYFETNDKRSMLPRKSAYIDRQVERVERYLAKTDRILDVGCGIGKYTLPLLEKGYQVEGLDIAEGLLEQMKQHHQRDEPLSLHCADIAKPPEKLLGKFDVVIGFFALHHMYDLEMALKGIYQLLKPQGKVVFLEPNPYNILYYLQILLTPKMTWQGDKGILKMRPGSLFPLMKKVGFTAPNLARTGFFPPFIADIKGALFIERALESIPLWKPLLPFQIFSCKKEA